jgi:hypothetical protein
VTSARYLPKGARSVQRKSRTITKIFMAVLLFSVLIRCGNGGSSGEGSDLLSGSATIKGSITSESGGQGDLAGWNLCLMDKELGFCRTATVDSAGLFTLKGVDSGRIYTLVLMSPSQIFSAILAVPSSEKTGFLSQYFKISTSNLPRIIYKGSTLGFQNTTGIVFDKAVVKDTGSDGIPDGMTAGQFSLNPSYWSEENLVSPSIDLDQNYETGLSQGNPYPSFDLNAKASTIDTDRDGQTNQQDADLDGDGIPNVFDADDDGDGVLDILDRDANGDLVNDATSVFGDGYFGVGVEWIAVNYALAKQEDNSTKKLLTVVAKVRSGVNPSAVQIKAPNTLIKNATVDVISNTGTTTSSAFDGLLMDDGKNGDGAANDGFFARTIILPTSAVTVRNMVLLVQLRFGSEADAKYMEFPNTFPPIALGTVTALHSGSSTLGTFQCCSGNPFGASVTDYSWSVKVFDAAGKLFFASPSQAGASAASTYTMPTGIWENLVSLAGTGEKFTYKVSASLFDRIPGYPPFNIQTKNEDVVTGN